MAGASSAVEWMTSLGLDIGTSTTKLIVSRLAIANVAHGFSLPAYRIQEREIVYMSDMHPTPLLHDDELDMERLMQLLGAEYKRAGLQLADLDTGAVIITGETAIKRNAREVTHELADRAGDFVVACAGADLEAVLAGKGSGAEAYSLQQSHTVVNVDIGGGTANAAYFGRGACIATVTLRIGGRLIRVAGDGTIEAVASSIQPWLQAEGIELRARQQVSLDGLHAITDRMADTLLAYLCGQPAPHAALLLVGAAPVSLPPFEELMLSGGVAELLAEEPPRTLAEAARYGDIGPLLAGSVAKAAERFALRVVPARHTSRATVIGAGTRTLELSGATVYLTPGVLPARNVPVAAVTLPAAPAAESAAVHGEIHRAVETAMQRYGQAGDSASPPFALALTAADYCSYRDIQCIADAISAACMGHCAAGCALVILCRSDMAKALGQSLALRIGGRMRIVCLDGLAAHDGDYIDLGEPRAGGAVVPVIIKTLAFA